MAQTMPCDACRGLGGTASIEGEYPNAKVVNEKCTRCKGKGSIVDPDGR